MVVRRQNQNREHIVLSEILHLSYLDKTPHVLRFCFLALASETGHIHSVHEDSIFSIFSFPGNGKYGGMAVPYI